MRVNQTLPVVQMRNCFYRPHAVYCIGLGILLKRPPVLPDLQPNKGQHWKNGVWEEINNVKLKTRKPNVRTCFLAKY